LNFQNLFITNYKVHQIYGCGADRNIKRALKREMNKYVHTENVRIDKKSVTLIVYIIFIKY